MADAKGFFISVEGGDGSGKSTQLDNIRSYFAERNIPAISTREPGGTTIGEKIRSVILDKENVEMCDITEAMLYAAARAQHVEQKIKPAIKEGLVVICDRFVDSSIAYQGYGRKLGKLVKDINDYAVAGCMPDITFFLDVKPEDAMNRIGKRNLDRLEIETRSFHERVYQGYSQIISENIKEGSNRIVKVDASRSAGEVKEAIYEVLDKTFGSGKDIW